MHQQARMPPRVSSPASSPQTTSGWANSSREVARQRAGSSMSGRSDALGSPTLESPPANAPPADSVKKLDQIVQNFYTKVATIVIDSRMKVKYVRLAKGQKKLNKWFQIETHDIEDFREELRIWKGCGSFESLPPVLDIEIYLDTARLKDSQSLVIVDENGKRWDVMEQLNTLSDDSPPKSTSQKNTEVILERWRVGLKTTGAAPNDDFGPTLPTIYKKAIVFFRTLFITTRLLPAWKFASQSPAKSSHPALIPKCRVCSPDSRRQRPDRLRHPIDGRPDPVTEYVFGDLDVPVGRLSTSVTYRNDCNFRVDDSEALLSSRFMGVDENFFKPSLPQSRASPRRPMAEVGSLGNNARRPKPTDMHQTYGSLSTFHGAGPIGTSPISALRAVHAPGSDTSSPPGSAPTNTDIEPPHSLPIGRASGARPSLRALDLPTRRPSISFQPFKAGSLSGSPVTRQADPDSPASPHSLHRPSLPSLHQPRNRTSLTAGMPSSLRTPQPTSIETTTTGSPRPASASRYSSSFTHRRGRSSFGAGVGKAGDDEQGSSGIQSLASSVAQPGSGFLAEAPGTSSESLHTEDDAISEFLKVLDSKKTLKSFEGSKRGEAATNRTVTQLSKFHMMKESNNALTDSMTSSVQMQRSSSSSSRQLTSVPGMAAPASLSASSSPGKPMSPHTPHTPAIPSRLSENSIIDYSNQGRITSRQGNIPETVPSGPSRESTITQDGTTAIDIPLSPRLESYQRRSSLAALQSRSGDDDDGDAAFAHRSISLGAEDGEPPTISTLLGRQMRLEQEPTERGENINSALQPAAEIQTNESSDIMQRGSADGNPPEGLMTTAVSSSPFGRRRYMGMAAAGRRQTPPQSSRGSFTGSVSRLPRGDDESVNEEPLMFDLSEMDPQGRKSLEEGRGGHAGSGSSIDRGTFEPRGITRRGW